MPETPTKFAAPFLSETSGGLNFRCCGVFHYGVIDWFERLEVLSLACGDKRFKEIRNQIPGITPKVLSQELKMLQTNNLVVKIADVDSRVGYYTLTKKCESLKKVIHGLKEWGDFHRTAIFKRTIKTEAIPW